MKPVLDQGFPAGFTKMRYWLLRTTLLLAALLDIWNSLSFATPTLHKGIEPVARVIAQQQRGLPSAASLPPTSRHLPPLAIPNALGKRGSIYKEELGSSILLHYRVFQVLIPELKIPI